MIAVTILSILTVTGYTTYSQSQIRGRDVTRKNDLVQIASALEVYYQQNGHYPCTTGWQYSLNSTGNWITDEAITDKKCGIMQSGTAVSTVFDTKYLRLPTDPINNGNQPKPLCNGQFGSDRILLHEVRFGTTRSKACVRYG